MGRKKIKIEKITNERQKNVSRMSFPKNFQAKSQSWLLTYRLVDITLTVCFLSGLLLEAKARAYKESYGAGKANRRFPCHYHIRPDRIQGHYFLESPQHHFANRYRSHDPRTLYPR